MSPYRVDSRLSGRHPFELFALYLAILVSLPTVLGLVPEPGSIREALPAWIATVWAWAMLLGASTALAGVYWRDRASGLILEQLGLGVFGVTNIIYAGAVLYAVGLSSIIPAAMIGGFGAACLRRYFQIQQIIDSVHEAERVQKGQKP